MAQGGSHMEMRRSVFTRIVISLLVVMLGGLLGDCRPARAGSSVAVPIFGTVDGTPESVYVSGVAQITSKLMKTSAKFNHPRSVMLSIDLHNVSGQGLSTGATYVTESQEEVMRPLVASDQVEITFPLYSEGLGGLTSARAGLASFTLTFDVGTGALTGGTPTASPPAAAERGPRTGPPAGLSKVQGPLGDGVGKDVFFSSISIDPTRDPPAVLKAYAEKFHVGPGWLFLTGNEDDIKLVAKKLGLSCRRDALTRDGHSASLMIGDEAAGQWMRNSAVDNPRFLATTISNFMGWKNRQPGRRYTEVSGLPTLDTGAYVFQSRCSACHTVGKGDTVGPDPAGVTTRRERSWQIGRAHV